jgi:hypothetical protein
MQPLSVVSARIGQTIEVPRPTQPDEAIVARIHGIPSSIVEGVMGVVFKSSIYKIRVNGHRTSNRFVQTTADQPHLMIEPEDLGYACPFAYQPITEFLIRGGGTGKGSPGMTVSFYSMRFAPVSNSSSSCTRTSQ